MSTLGRGMDERELDALLRSFLREGPDDAPTSIAERAVTEAARYGQRRRFIARPSPKRISVPAAWAAGAAVVVIAFAVSLELRGVANPAPSGTPTTSPRPTPSATQSLPPTVAPSGLRLVRSQTDGYELLVPGSWTEVDSSFSDVRSWVGSDGALMVSYGASIFDGGAVTECGPATPEWPTCRTEHYGYSVPYKPEVDGVAPLSLEGYVRDRCSGGCAVTVTDTTLGGERAEQNRTTAAGYRVTYASTFHDRRPVIVYWSQPVAVADDSRFEQVRGSFRFIDSATRASATPFVDPTELVVYRNGEDGYEIRIPRFWDIPRGPYEQPFTHEQYAGVRVFGSGRGFGTGGDPALTISVGRPDGSIFLCQSSACHRIVATSLDELEAALPALPETIDSSVPRKKTGSFVLGGERARFQRPGYRLAGGGFPERGISGIAGGNCLGCPAVVYYAFTLHDGRPVVLAWDWWTIAFETYSPEYVVEIIDSFRFLE